VYNYTYVYIIAYLRILLQIINDPVTDIIPGYAVTCILPTEREKKDKKVYIYI